MFSLFSFFHNIEITRKSLLEKKMDITKYFKKSNDKLDGRAPNLLFHALPLLQCFLLQEMNSVQEEQDRKRKEVLPEKVKKDVAYCNWKHGNPEARRWASKSTQITPLKERLLEIGRSNIKAFESNEIGNFFALPRERPSKMGDELTAELKSILHNLRVNCGAVTRKTVIAIGNGILKARCPEMLEENGGNITLTTKWARGVLESLDWVKRRYTTAKREI